MTTVEKHTHRGNPNFGRPLRWIEIVQGGIVGLIVLLIVAMALIAYRSGAMAAFLGPSRPNVIIIIVADALRADRLSCYGYTKNQTPHIDALAQDAVRFPYATAESSWTKPSVGTIFTGMYPLSHQARIKGTGPAETLDTLAEALAAHDYYNVGFITNPMIRPGLNFEQGFDEYIRISRKESKFALNGRTYYPEAAVVNQYVLGKFQEDHPRRYMYIHYMDPHRPYFEHPYNGQGYHSHGGGYPDQAGELSDLYDGEVSYLDTHIGELIAGLKAKGIYDNALIIFTADHGEEFFEHRGWAHGRTVYQEVIHVPLIVKYPGGWGAGTVDDRLAQLADLAPTILDVAGIETPATMQGVSLLRPASEPRDSQIAFSETEFEGHVSRTIVTSRYKLVQVVAGDRRGRNPVQLYDLVADPGETTDLAAAHVSGVRRLRQYLDRTMIAALEASVEGKTVEIDPETEERLRMLGY